MVLFFCQVVKRFPKTSFTTVLPADYSCQIAVYAVSPLCLEITFTISRLRRFTFVSGDNFYY